MADYVSSLNGSQMDQALIDMAEHNSEAWAVGQRNGIDVPSDDITYHNNAQYYASQAQSIAPASVTEAVRWDIAQTALTDANKEQARSNIDAGKNGAWSNRNLLDNWYFVGGGSQLGDGVFPINQRGLTSYSANGYGIDRWICYGGAITLAADGISVPANGVFTQPTDNLTQLNGETLTLSVLYDSGIETGTAVLDLSGTTMFINNGAAGQTYITSGGLVQTYKGTASKIRAIKLEKGTVSTLPNDPPPDFGEELRKCQRYLWVKTFPANTQIGVGSCIDATTVVANIVTPVAMRANVIATFTANVLLLGEGTLAVASAVTGIGAYDNNIRIILSSAGLTAYKLYSFFTSTETTMTISAEL